MKHRRFLFAFLISLAAFQFCFSQEKPKAVLIDEFGKVNCEELFTKFHRFTLEVFSEPTSVGYVVIHGKRSDLQQSDLYRKQIRGYVDSLSDEKISIMTVKGKDEEFLKTQLWKVPLNADITLSFEKWNLSTPNFTKSIKFYNDALEGSCSSDDGRITFAELLLENPNLSGHLVIKERTLKEFKETERKLLKRFENKYGVSRNRLKTFYRKVENDFDSDVEYWLVRKK